MINLSIEEILRLHQKLLDATGGSPGLRELSLLESAVYGAQQSFADAYVYPTPEQRAARLAFSITQNHPFVDGNKRIGILAMLMTLRLNHVAVNYTQAELIALGLSVADGLTGYDGILDWINQHKD